MPLLDVCPEVGGGWWWLVVVIVDNVDSCSWLLLLIGGCYSTELTPEKIIALSCLKEFAHVGGASHFGVPACS